MSMPKPWKLAGPVKATGRFRYWYVAWKGVVLLARPQPTSRVARSMPTAASMARFADDRRVRTLDRARMKPASGASRMSGTAQARVVEGSKVKPPLWRVPDAVPEAASRMPTIATSRFSETPPGPLFRHRARRGQARSPRSAPRPPGRRSAARRPRRTVPRRRTRRPRRRRSVGSRPGTPSGHAATPRPARPPPRAPTPPTSRRPGRRSPAALANAPTGRGTHQRDEHQRPDRLGREGVVVEEEPADRGAAERASEIPGVHEVTAERGEGEQGEERRGAESAELAPSRADRELEDAVPRPRQQQRHRQVAHQDDQRGQARGEGHHHAGQTEPRGGQRQPAPLPVG